MSESSPAVRDPGFLKWLIVMGLIEGTSTLVLGGAMLTKYVFIQSWGPMATSIAGNIHGILFIVYVLMLFVGWRRIPTSGGLLLAGLVGAVVPFGPFLVDIPLFRLLKGSSPGSSG